MMLDASSCWRHGSGCQQLLEAWKLVMMGVDMVFMIVCVGVVGALLASCPPFPTLTPPRSVCCRATLLSASVLGCYSETKEQLHSRFPQASCGLV